MWYSDFWWQFKRLLKDLFCWVRWSLVQRFYKSEKFILYFLSILVLCGLHFFPLPQSFLFRDMGFYCPFTFSSIPSWGNALKLWKLNSKTNGFLCTFTLSATGWEHTVHNSFVFTSKRQNPEICNLMPSSYTLMPCNCITSIKQLPHFCRLFRHFCDTKVCLKRSVTDLTCISQQAVQVLVWNHNHTAIPSPKKVQCKEIWDTSFVLAEENGWRTK